MSTSTSTNPIVNFFPIETKKKIFCSEGDVRVYSGLYSSSEITLWLKKLYYASRRIKVFELLILLFKPAGKILLFPGSFKTLPDDTYCNMLTSIGGWLFRPLHFLPVFIRFSGVYHFASGNSPITSIRISVFDSLSKIVSEGSNLSSVARNCPHSTNSSFLKIKPRKSHESFNSYNTTLKVLKILAAILAVFLFTASSFARLQNQENAEKYIDHQQKGDRFKLKELYSKYVYLTDNKTVKKFSWIVKKEKKNPYRQKASVAAERSLDYYQSKILPGIKNAVISVSRKLAKSKNTGSFLGSDEYIYIFMSSSVPESTWKNYIKAINRLRRSGQDGIGIILRGCIGGCAKVLPTAKFIYHLLKQGENTYRVPILIDPLLFRLFGIKRVPVAVYARHVDMKYPWLSPGVSGNLSGSVTAYKVIGDCGLVYILKELYEQSGSGAVLKLYNILTEGWLEKNE